MPSRYHTPGKLYPSRDFGYSQLVSTSGATTLYCAGIVGWDRDMQLAGPDLETQLDAALVNIGLALADAGAGLEDVVRLELYLVDYNPEQLETISAVLHRHFDGDRLPANTLLGVQSLALPELLVEITATAVIDT